MIPLSDSRSWPDSWPGHTVYLKPESLSDARERAREQTAQYGHDSGYFSLGRKDSSHEIGVIGEVVVLEFLRSLNSPCASSYQLGNLGAQFDIAVEHNGKAGGLHVKTGRYRTWPDPEQPFGVHFGQKLEMTAAGLILVSLIASDPGIARIEGIMRPSELAECRILERGETFPGRSYPSRTRNRLTFVKNYRSVNPDSICSLIHPAHES